MTEIHTPRKFGTQIGNNTPQLTSGAPKKPFFLSKEENSTPKRVSSKTQSKSPPNTKTDLNNQTVQAAQKAAPSAAKPIAAESQSSNNFSFFAFNPIKTTTVYLPPQKYTMDFLLSFKDNFTEKPNFFCCDLIIEPFLDKSPKSEKRVNPVKVQNPKKTKDVKSNNNNNNNNNAQTSAPSKSVASKTSKAAPKKETDAKRLLARQKQIDIGMNTIGYKNFMKIYETLSSEEKLDTNLPRVPNKLQICSKRSWDGQVRKWRRMLHLYDDPKTDSIVIPTHSLSDDEDDETNEN